MYQHDWDQNGVLYFLGRMAAIAAAQVFAILPLSSPPFPPRPSLCLFIQEYGHTRTHACTRARTHTERERERARASERASEKERASERATSERAERILPRPPS